MADQVQAPESGGGEGKQSQPAEPVSQPQVEDTKQEIKTPEVKTETPEVKPETEVKQPELKETKPDETKEVKPEVAQAAVEEKKEAVETKAPEAKDDSKAEAKVASNGVAGNISNVQGDWQQRETDLLKIIDELEKVKAARTQESVLLELKVRDEEIDLLKSRVKNLETELQAALSKPSGKNHEMIENIKRQHEELLSKARGMIFDKTKMVKNQELQIEALTSQITSLKDINQITKDLLEIRNSEIKAMEDRLQAMEARFKAEKDRYGLVLQRAQTSSNINDDLRKEYETQLKLFKELREKYDQRVQALVAENERLKASLNPGGTPNAGTAPGTSG